MNCKLPIAFATTICIFSGQGMADAPKKNAPKPYTFSKPHPHLPPGNGAVVRNKPKAPHGTTASATPTASAESRKRQNPYTQADTGFSDPNCVTYTDGYADIINGVAFTLWSDDVNAACSVPAPVGNRTTWLVDADGPKWCLDYLFAQDYDYVDPSSPTGTSTRPLVDPAAYSSSSNDDPAIDTLTGSTPLSLYTASFLCMGAGDTSVGQTQGRCVYYALTTEGLSVAETFNACFNNNNYVDRYASSATRRFTNPLTKLFELLRND